MIGENNYCFRVDGGSCGECCLDGLNEEECSMFECGDTDHCFEVVGIEKGEGD